MEGANEELLGKATKLIAKLESEREMQQRIAEAASLCEISSFQEAEGKDDLPEWCKDTEKFEDFHRDYKKVVQNGERDQVSEQLMTKALEQLTKIEHLLIEKKQIEQEMALKASKKKGKKK